jgi:hypothetical protein
MSKKEKAEALEPKETSYQEIALGKKELGLPADFALRYRRFI